MMSEKQKMIAGDWYNCVDPDLEAMRKAARNFVHEHNTISPNERGHIGPLLRKLIAQCDGSNFVEAPFHCAYGVNIHLGKNAYLNAGCTILDTAKVSIGASTMLGPYVQIYCAEHHRDAALRNRGLEIARAVNIGENVWVGGGAVILGGVEIGDGAIIGAGSIVTKNVPAGTTAAGNPAKQI